jgi:RNA polymerase sigma factor (sigma-70 family)
MNDGSETSLKLAQVLDGLPDVELHKLVVCRNERALGVLMERYNRDVVRMIADKGPEDAEDAASEAWVAYWEKPAEWKSEFVSLRGWIYSIAKCRMVEHWKRGSVWLSLKDKYRDANSIKTEGVSAMRNRAFMQEVPTVDPEVEKNELLYLFSNFLRMISMEQATPLQLWILSGLTEGEIARHLEIRVKLIHCRLWQARIRLIEWFTLGRILSTAERKERLRAEREAKKLIKPDEAAEECQRLRRFLRRKAQVRRRVNAVNQARAEESLNPKRERRPKTVITAALSTGVRQRYAEDGVTYKQLVAEFGIAMSTVSNIVRARSPISNP